MAAGLIGLTLGWVWPLTYLVYLCPVAVALAVIDFRTYLLPTKIIAPSYGVVGALILLSFAFDQDVDDLARAAAGWAIAGLVYVLLWFFTPGMGYGDVRLSGVLGLALGYLGWGELLVGVYSGFLLGGLGWVVLRLAGLTKTRHYPAGPFMLIGALVGVLWGADFWTYLRDEPVLTRPRQPARSPSQVLVVSRAAVPGYHVQTGGSPASGESRCAAHRGLMRMQINRRSPPCVHPGTGGPAA